MHDNVECKVNEGQLRIIALLYVPFESCKCLLCSPDLEAALNPFGCSISVVDPTQTAVLMSAVLVHCAASQIVPTTVTSQSSVVSHAELCGTVVIISVCECNIVLALYW